MTDRSQYDEALYRLEASDWQRQEGGGDPMQEAAAAHVHATLALVDELRRLNEGRDQWYREVLGVLTQAKDREGSPVGSEQPAAAPDGQEGGEPRACRVCGREGNTYCEPGDGPLTKAQWDAHRRNYLRVITIDDELLAHQQANEHTLKRFGPCPEES